MSLWRSGGSGRWRAVRLRETTLAGVFVLELDPIQDERGFFARAWSAEQLAERGLDATVVQCNISYNDRAGTLRGMHYQADPYGETKVVRCTAGAIFDVALDLRLDSETYLRWYGVELSAANRRALYIPEGVAHGFQTLVDGTEIFYLMSRDYVPAAGRGVRWDDPAFGITWPESPERVISDRDRSFPLFRG